MATAPNNVDTSPPPSRRVVRRGGYNWAAPSCDYTQGGWYKVRSQTGIPSHTCPHALQSKHMCDAVCDESLVGAHISSTSPFIFTCTSTSGMRHLRWHVCAPLPRALSRLLCAVRLLCIALTPCAPKVLDARRRRTIETTHRLFADLRVPARSARCVWAESMRTREAWQYAWRRY